MAHPLKREEDMAAFPAKEGIPAILKRYAPDMEGGLVDVLTAIAVSVGSIGDHLRSADADSKAGSSNAFGDHQLDVDLHTDDIIFRELKASGAVSVAASEEKPEETDMGGSASKCYSVAFDPLDGSSIVDANFAVGTIVGVWPSKRLLGCRGREQVASCMSMYGPRTTMIVALAGDVVGGDGGRGVAFELTFCPAARKWSVSRERLTIAPSGKVFAPGNLRATADHPRYKELFDHWVDNRYTLRYTGGMVPDVYHILMKGKGVFANVPSASAGAKLRLLYEVAPIALIVEAAGGMSVVAPEPPSSAEEAAPALSGAISPLDVPVDNLDRRLGVCYGGCDEAALFNKFMFAPE